MITIREYAKQKNVSYEAVRRQIIKYRENELLGHIFLEGRTQLLDDYAVQFLDEKRQSNKMVVLQVDKDETIKRLEKEKESLLLELATTKDELASAYKELRQQDKEILALKEENKRLQEPGSEEQTVQSAAEPSAGKPWWKFWQN